MDPEQTPPLSVEDQDAASIQAMKANRSFMAPSSGGKDLTRIKANVAKMAGMNAPESDIDGYIAAEGTTVDEIRNFKAGSSQNVAHETSTQNSPGLGRQVLGAGGRFLAGMGGEIVNMGKGVAQTFLNPIESEGIANPNPQIQGAADQLKHSVDETRKVIDTTGLSGKAGQFVAHLLPWLAAPEVPAIAMGAAESATQPQGEGEQLNRLTAGAKGAATAEAGNQMLGGIANRITSLFKPGTVLKQSLSTLKQQHPDVQNQVFDRAQTIIDDGRQAGVTLTGPEALQQSMEEHGLGGTSKLGTLQRVVENSPQGEGAMAAVTGARAAQVQQAGSGLLKDTFGPGVSPDQATATTQAAAGKLVTNAVRGRTDATQPLFKAAREEALPPDAAAPLQALKDKLDAEIKLTGPDNSLGKKLQTFRDLMDQNGDNLGPLIETNRTYAENLYKKYNPLDPTNTFNNREVAALAPFNKELQGILEQASPQYSGGLKTYQGLSPAVREVEEGALGRMANQGGTDPGARLNAMSDEFLSDQARPGDVRKLAAQISTINPQAVPQLVGARLDNIFAKATQDLQSGSNPWGGAKFITQVMGNTTQRANLEATIKSLPEGDRKWAAFNKLATILKATGKRKPAGSETAMNLGVQQELASVPGKVSSNPLAWADNMLGTWATNRNGAELARVFTHPQAAKEMQKLISLAPNSPKARLIAASILTAVNPGGATPGPEAPAEQSTTIAAPPALQPVAFQSPNDSYVSKTVTKESHGNPNAKSQVKGATAAGAAGFTNHTWMHMIDQYRPELMVGKTTRQILDLRNNEALSREMADHYGNENAASLAKAGLPVNDTTKYLAHFLGPGDAKRLLNAKVGTPVGQVINRQSIRANQRILAGKKVEDILRFAQKAMGELPEPSAGPQ